MSDDRRDAPQGADGPEEESRLHDETDPRPQDDAGGEEVPPDGEDPDGEDPVAEDPVAEDAGAEDAGAEDPLASDPSDPSTLPEEEEGEPGETPRASTGDEIALLTAELDTTRRERDEYLDGLRRLKAEFDNSRKRMERERERIYEMASERVVTGLLPVLDSLERALEVEGDLREGVRATRDQLHEVLRREGLVPIESDGEAFDPSVHEAVMGQLSDEHEDGTIIQTFERGYVLNGRAIRPAKVVVARQG